MSKDISLKEALVRYGKAAYPLANVPEEDEIQIRRAVLAACKAMNRKMRTWTVTNGLIQIDDETNPVLVQGTDKHRAMLAKVAQELASQKARKPTEREAFVYVLHDFREWIKDPIAIRFIRDLVPALKSTPAMILFAGPGFVKPPELEREIVDVHLPMPEYSDALSILRDCIPKAAFSKLSDTDKMALVEAGRGLNFHELECNFALAASSKELNPKTIWANKAKIVDSAELQFVDSDVTLDDIGGMDVAKEWLIKRSKAYTPEARDYGIEPPLGCVFLGPPGTAKSYMAKAIGSVFDAPILRLNMGACMRPHVGESERIVRELMDRIDKIGKVVVWLDEFEKMFAAASTSGQSDSGLFLRMFGEFLTWMGERAGHGSQCFLAATCNAIKDLQSALTRAGRFDAVFYVDLPNYEERKAIAKIHVGKRQNMNVNERGYLEIAGASDGYSGAEIEQAIKAAMFSAFMDGGRKTTAEDIIQQIKESKSSAELYAEELREMEKWKSRCVVASKEDKSGTVDGTRAVFNI